MVSKWNRNCDCAALGASVAATVCAVQLCVRFDSAAKSVGADTVLCASVVDRSRPATSTTTEVRVPSGACDRASSGSHSV